MVVQLNGISLSRFPDGKKSSESEAQRSHQWNQAFAKIGSERGQSGTVDISANVTPAVRVLNPGDSEAALISGFKLSTRSLTRKLMGFACCAAIVLAVTKEAETH